jgi:Rps23 Pro-64 3,4-dihydroxylase Tpa1-like proline 4-hydroxylase
VASEAEAFILAAEDDAWSARARGGLSAAGRVHLPGFLARPAAQSLAGVLDTLPWDILLNDEQGKSYRLGYTQLMAMDAQERNRIVARVYQNAQAGPEFFSDMYHVTELYMSGACRDGVLADFHAQLNSQRGLAALRKLVGDDRINHVDAIASRYRPGQFLAAHTDSLPGEDRLYAYVLNLARQWRVHWGGQLLFFDNDGNIIEGYTPRMGALNIFKVPQAHAVSIVAPFAMTPRYSISGWFHATAPPSMRAS